MSVNLLTSPYFTDTRLSPSDKILSMLTERGVPEEFVTDQVSGYIAKQGETANVDSVHFIGYILRTWSMSNKKGFKAKPASVSRSKPMTAEWRPSVNTIDLLTKKHGVTSEFIENELPEFIIYWIDKGVETSTWNSIFIKRIAALQEQLKTLKAKPRATFMPREWAPSEETQTLLAVDGIYSDQVFELVAEFKIYWCDRNEARHSWNALFIQYVRNRKKMDASNHSSTRARTLRQDLSDKSWVT